MKPRILAIVSLLLIVYSCKKWSDPHPPRDPILDQRKYCNDPDAVNYNWGFPGTADSTVCFYPSDLFQGTWLFTDSVYNSQDQFDSAGSLVTYTLHFFGYNKKKLALTGFCGPADSLILTAERSSFRAYADTTIMTSDTTFGYGQFFCRTLDTLTGFFTKDLTDSLGNRMLIDLRVVSDTGINFHRGTAYRQ